MHIEKRQKRGDVIYPTLTKWPSISKRMIGKVGRAVLRILVSLFFEYDISFLRCCGTHKILF